MQASVASHHPGTSAAVAGAVPCFVINLSASTTPVALSQPSHPELKRFTFFVSRRREEGRERFRLHMGYFATQAEAEGLLELVRDIYPGAWAGLAPGQKLKERAPIQPVLAATLADIAPQLSPPAPQPDIAGPALTLVPDEPRRAAAADETAAHSLLNLRKTLATLDDPAPQPRPASLAEPADAKVLSEAATLSLLESAALRREPACFAVQLMWSVQPIDMGALPQLAIFAAYTLYGAEGNRGGRRWYGLRLGFFTDAMSAKQVAQYVRSEFSTVSVVPVTGRERERARIAAARPIQSVARSDGAAMRPSAANASKPAAPRNASLPRNPPTSELRFIDDTQAKLPAGVPGARVGRGTAPGKRAKLRPAAPRPPKPQLRKKPLTLEETLEILGAGDLQVDDGRKASINDSGVRHLRLEPVKARPSRLGRLIDRLAERIGSD